MSGKKQAVGYVRCSTEMQEDSPELQKKRRTTSSQNGIRTISESQR